MPPLPRLTSVLTTALVLLLLAGATPAEDVTADLSTAYGQAMAEFQTGNYASAATQLEALVARVAVTPQVEPIFYTVGCAWFNAGDYPKAIAAFRNYQTKFPKGPHAGSVTFAIAQSNLLNKNFKDAATQMAALENDPQLREQALLFEGEAFQAAGKIDGAIGALEKLAGKEISTAKAMRGATMLARLYAQKGDGAKVLRTLEAIHQKIALAENIIELNGLTVELGDKFYKEQQYTEALACYRLAWPRDQIIRLQNERIAGMRRQIEQNLAAPRSTGPTSPSSRRLISNSKSRSPARKPCSPNSRSCLQSRRRFICASVAAFTSSIASGKQSSSTRKFSIVFLRDPSANRPSSV